MSPAMPKIVFDRKNCEGLFVCSASDPDTWEENVDENKVDLVDGKELDDGLYELEIDADRLELALEAAEGCPVDVIKVLDDDGNVLAGPEELPIEQ